MRRILKIFTIVQKQKYEGKLSGSVRFNQLPILELIYNYSDKQLKIYEKKMKDEEEINKELCQMKEGEWVAYGNEIQLQHHDSKGKRVRIL